MPAAEIIPKNSVERWAGRVSPRGLWWILGTGIVLRVTQYAHNRSLWF